MSTCLFDGLPVAGDILIVLIERGRKARFPLRIASRGNEI
jgi:hypothetical protein